MTFDLAQYDHVRKYLLLAGLAALVVMCIVALLAPAPALYGYLSAYMFWLSVPLGCAALIMLGWLIPGRWMPPAVPVLVGGVRTGILFVPLFIPVAVGVYYLYPWAGSALRIDSAASVRAGYLNVPFFLGRAGGYLTAWVIGGWIISRVYESGRGRASPQGAAKLASVGMIIYILTMSFAAIDWVGSLERDWYSSIFGLYLIMGQALLALTLAVLASFAIRFRGQDLAPPADTRQDQGTLLLALVSLHAYMAFSQFLIIWNGNLPHEISWYVNRSAGIWGIVCVVLLLGHFGLPFVILLSRERKRSRWWLPFACIVLLIMRVMECVWMVIPSGDQQVVATFCAGVAWLGMGAVWLAVFMPKLAVLLDGSAVPTQEGIEAA